MLPGVPNPLRTETSFMSTAIPRIAAGKADTIVIGGGIFGLFTALTVAEAGKSVIVLDKGPTWAEASAVNAGSLGVQNKLPALVPYTLWSWDIWNTLPDRLNDDLGLRRNGGYKIALSEDEAARLEKVVAEQIGSGLEAQRLSPRDLCQQAPWITPDCVAATWSPQDGYASPTRVGPALRRKLKSLGVRIIEGAAVVAVEKTRDIRVLTTAGDFYGTELAITAGAWSATVAAMLGVTIPISLDVNMVSVTEPARPTIGCIVTHARGILTLKQVANGSCLIGGGWQGIGSISDSRKDIDHDQLVHNLRLALRVIPGLAQLNVLRSWAGYEGVTPDSYPYLGRLPGHDNVYLAACARGGFTLGPLMGTLLGELILTDHPSRPITIFDPGRFTNAAA